MTAEQDDVPIVGGMLPDDLEVIAAIVIAALYTLLVIFRLYLILKKMVTTVVKQIL